METDRIFPDNWKEIIQSKKVIFYNTSVGSLLQGREKHVEKMKWVFETFLEHREVVLWWRPHPLEFSTIESMIPELTNQYLELRKWYKDSQAGILDESADLNRVIAISDAYYGDWSSVVELYKAAGKPILFQNDKIRAVHETEFFPGALCVKDENIWFIQMNSNKLVRMNRTTFGVEEIISIPMERPFKQCQYNYHIIDAENKLFLLLEKSQNVYEYDLKTRVIKAFPINGEKQEFHGEIVMKYNGKLLLFPYGNNRILEYNCDSGVVINKSSIGSKALKAARCHEVVNKNLYMVDSYSNRVYKYDLSNNSYIQIELGNVNNRYWGIKKAGKYYVLPHLEKKIITLWNEESGEIIELKDFPEQYRCLDGNAYLDMFEKDGDLFVFPLYANMILRIDVTNKIITQGFQDFYFDADYSLDSDNMSEEMYLCAKNYDGNIYAYAYYKHCWQIFDLVSGKVWNSPVFEITDAEHRELLECLIDNEVYCGETFCESEIFSICTLDNYIYNVANHIVQSRNWQADKDTIGSRIYKFLTELMAT